MGPQTFQATTGMVLAASLLVTGAMAGTTSKTRPVSSVVPCSQGLAALTFDDGPDRRLTPELLDILTTRRVPAVFFVNGRDVDTAPWVVRDAHARGFTIANHTYDHEQLTRLSAGSIRTTLDRTRRAIRAAGADSSPLMRPPYGLMDARVRSVVQDHGYVPVMWTVDPRDWERVSATTIADRVLGLLRPHRRNVVLQHDGIGNSPSTVAAVPRIIRGARARGYCFAAIGSKGRVLPPVPRASVTAGTTTEAAGASLTVTVRLDRPTSRPTSVLLRTTGGNATPGADYLPVERRLVFPTGARTVTTRVPVLDDRLDENVERVRLRLSSPRGMLLRTARATAVIHDDDPLPRLTITDATLTEPVQGATTAEVEVRLREPSGRRVAVTVRAEAGSAGSDDFAPVDVRLRFAPGETLRTVPVTVLADAIEEEVETFVLRLLDVRAARLVRPGAIVTILPPAQ